MAFANILDNTALQDCLQDNLYGGDCKYTETEITFILDKIKALIVSIDIDPQYFITVETLKNFRDFLIIKNCLITDYCRALDDYIPYIESYISKLEEEMVLSGMS